jgi:UPF0716 protein FxsA
MRRRVPWWLLALLFVVVPMVEIYLLIQVGQVVGPWWTILLLVGAGVLGSYLLKREGGRAWSALREALGRGRMPARELADGALILVGGTLLLTPGFLSDVVGLFCILPVTRPVARRVLTVVVARRLGVTGVGMFGPGSPAEATRTPRRPGTDESVVQGEVVD